MTAKLIYVPIICGATYSGTIKCEDLYTFNDKNACQQTADKMNIRSSRAHSCDQREQKQ